MAEQHQSDAEIGRRVREAAVLRPCHTTGMHNPTHCLDHPKPHACELQRADVALRLIEAAGLGDLVDLPREVHPNCYWCGTDARSQSGEEQRSSQADAFAAWANDHRGEPDA